MHIAYYVDKRIKVNENDNKNKRENWRRAIRLLEKHLTRAKRAQKL